MTTTLARPRTIERPAHIKHPVQTRITLFHCFNALNSASFLDFKDCEIRSLKLPCSGMIREVILLKAFEAGADAVLVLVCPENSCHYVQGNIRTRKKVSRVKKILDEIGLDGRRLNIFNIPPGDQTAVAGIIEHTLSDLDFLGPGLDF